MSTRTLIAEAREIVRRGLVEICTRGGLQMVGEVVRCEDLAQTVQQTTPEVLIADPRLPGGDCFEILERLKQEFPALCVLIVSEDDSPTVVGRSRGIGAAEFLTLQATGGELLDAVTRATRGEIAPSGSPLHSFKERMLRPRTEAESQTPLTERELQVLRHVAHGLSNREIGGSLGISIETVKEHVQNILRKIDAKDRTQAAVWAVRGGFV